MKNVILALWLFSCTNISTENNIIATETHTDIDLIFSTPDQVEYFETVIKPNIVRLSINDTIVPKSIIVAQAILESGNGTSKLSKINHNHFGHRIGNQWLNFKTDYESFLFHNELLKRRYVCKGNYILWARNLQRKGYCKDSTYAITLINTIKQYKLYELDRI